MHDPCRAAKLPFRCNQRLDLAAVAEENEFAVGMPGHRQRRAGNHHRWPVVTPHSVERDPDRMGHGLPWAANLRGAGRVVLL